MTTQNKQYKKLKILEFKNIKVKDLSNLNIGN